MTEKWYDELGNDAFLNEEDKEYRKTVEKIISAVKAGIGFDEACELIDIENVELKSTIAEDALKILIADMHFIQKMPTDKVAEILKISVDRINAARESMLEDVKEASIKAFYKGMQ